MRHVEIKFDVYSFDELNNDVQNVVVNEHAEMWCERGSNNEIFQECVAEMEKMRTPWFLPEVVRKKCREAIIEEIKINEYEFMSDGTFWDDSREQGWK